MNFDGVTLITEDVVALSEFYSQVLQAESEGGEVHAEIKTQGAGLVIYARSAAERDMGFCFEEHNGVGKMTLSFTVEDVDAEYERLQAIGVTFETQPTTYPWGNRAVHFRDPDGNIVGFRGRRRD